MDRSDSLASLHDVLAHAWALLERGAQDSRSGMSRPVLATRGLDDLPNARTVVLWRADAARRALYFHTDARSPKYAELQRTPWALLVFYDPETETQLRIHARVRASHNDGMAGDAWAELPAETRLVFATAIAPGRAANRPVSGPLRDAVSNEQEVAEIGYRNFVVLEAIVVHLDWLSISAAGHRRAAFTWTSDDGPTGAWLYP